MADTKERNKAAMRDSKGRFLKGVSGNPGGHHKTMKGLAAYLREQTNNFKEFADFGLKVVRNEEKIYKHEQQVEMWKILLDRGLGKAVATTIELDTEDLGFTPDLSNVPLEELSELREKVAEILTNKAGTASDGEV